jgi:hypothetical protein
VATRAETGGMPDGWVPVERRWLGLDKRTIPPALIAIALIAVFAAILPAVDRAIDYDREIEAGDVVDLGSGVTFVPAVGWGFPDGLLVSDDSVGGTEAVSHLSATLIHGGTSFSAITGPFDGTANELLDNILSLNEAYQSIDTSKYTSDRVTATTNDGVAGIAQGFVGVDVEGVIAAFVIDGVGIEFVVSGPPGSLEENTDAIYRMIGSLSKDETEGGQ